MKKFAAGFVLALLLTLISPLVFAANTCTAKSALPISIWGVTSVIPVECVIDTASSDVAIHTPISGNMAAIVGLNYAEGTPHDIKFTDGSDLQMTFELSTGGGLQETIGRKLFFIGQPGNAVKFQISVVPTGSVMFYVIEGARFHVDR